MDYRRLPLAEKQQRYRDRMREPAVVCPRCEMQMGVPDIVRHARECQGPREPHPLSRWIGWREATALVPKATLARWLASGRVRWRGAPHRRELLLRDVGRAWLGRQVTRRR